MQITNLPLLKIHQLTKEQYETAQAQGLINPSDLYMVSGEDIGGGGGGGETILPKMYPPSISLSSSGTYISITNDTRNQFLASNSLISRQYNIYCNGVKIGDTTSTSFAFGAVTGNITVRAKGGTLFGITFQDSANSNTITILPAQIFIDGEPVEVSKAATSWAQLCDGGIYSLDMGWEYMDPGDDIYIDRGEEMTPIPLYDIDGNSINSESSVVQQADYFTGNIKNLRGWYAVSTGDEFTVATDWMISGGRRYWIQDPTVVSITPGSSDDDGFTIMPLAQGSTVVAVMFYDDIDEYKFCAYSIIVDEYDINSVIGSNSGSSTLTFTGKVIAGIDNLTDAVNSIAINNDQLTITRSSTVNLKIYSTEKAKELKTFTLDYFPWYPPTEEENTFNYREGMTWADWKRSDYNRFGTYSDSIAEGYWQTFQNHDNGYMNINVSWWDTDLEGICNEDGTPVKDNEVIQSKEYIYNTYLNDYGSSPMFYISMPVDSGSVPYSFDEGMTWEEWVNSDYNTGGFWIGDNGFICYMDSGEAFVVYDGAQVGKDFSVERFHYDSEPYYGSTSFAVRVACGSGSRQITVERGQTQRDVCDYDGQYTYCPLCGAERPPDVEENIPLKDNSVIYCPTY